MKIKTERRRLPCGRYLDKTTYGRGSSWNGVMEYSIVRKAWVDGGRIEDRIFIGKEEYDVLYAISEEVK